MSQDEYEQLTEKDWRWATEMATGLSQAEISKILADHNLDFNKDGYKKCEEVVLKHGPAIIRKRSLN